MDFPNDLQHFEGETTTMHKIEQSQTGKFFVHGLQLPDTDVMEIASHLVIGKTTYETRKLTGRSIKAIKRVKMLLSSPINQNMFQRQLKPKGVGEHTNPISLGFFYDLITKYPIISVNELKEQYENHFKTTISLSMIHYIITKKLMLVYKQTEIVEYARTRPAIIRLREKFVFRHFFKDVRFFTQPQIN